MHHYIATQAQDLEDIYLIWEAALLDSYEFAHCGVKVCYSILPEV